MIVTSVTQTQRARACREAVVLARGMPLFETVRDRYNSDGFISSSFRRVMDVWDEVDGTVPYRYVDAEIRWYRGLV